MQLCALLRSAPLAAPLAAALSTAPLTPPDGLLEETNLDWAGWLYLEDGDVPLRLHLERGADGLAALVDLPAAGQTGVRLGSATVGEGALVLAHPSESDPKLLVEAVLGGAGLAADHLTGTVDWFGVGGRVELHRAASELVWEDPAQAAAAVGVYGAGDGPGLAVRAQPWGELVLVDPLRGHERTLFARPDGMYVAGPALYVPAPIEWELELQRSPEGEVEALTLRDGEGERKLPRREVHAVDLALDREGVVLEGTLTLPRRNDALIAVIAGGSDWTSRRRLSSYAAILAACGVGSLVYDKRGHGASSGEAVVPFSTTAGDLRAFAAALRDHGAVDGARVGYVGLSRGGWYGALAAAGDPAAAFFVSIVGPAVSPAEQETAARLARMRAAAAEEEELALGERYLDALWGFARTAEGGSRYLELRQEVRAAGWLGVLQGPESLEPEAWRWSRLNGDFDPLPSLRSLDCPALAIYAELDLAVDARVNAPRMRRALAASRADPAAVVELPGSDHGLRPVSTEADGRRLPFHRSPGFHPLAWSAVAEFFAGLR